MKKATPILITLIICLFVAIYLNRTDSPEKAQRIEGQLTVHFIDVGQGDSIFIETGKETILIDAGNKGQGQTVISYLEKLHIQQIDTVISTHPDADHIGGLADVINHYPVKAVYAPKVTHTTEAFKNFLLAVKKQDLKIKSVKQGVTIPTAVDGTTLEFLGPVKEYSKSDLNDWSAVLQLTHGANRFLFTGDSETPAEKDLLATNTLSTVDVLKVSHHGAKEASTPAFLNEINPTYAVISVGKGNRYGHPTSETLKRLKVIGATIIRTDQHGSIVFTSDGKNLSVKEER